MKKRLFLLIFLASLPGLFSQARENLEWSLALVDQNQENSLPFSRPVEMKTGDVFSLHIKPEKGCYAYVIAQDSERNVVIIHSGRLAANEALALGPMQITLPAGTESFYIVMSLTEQRDIRDKIRAFERAATGSRQRTSRDVMDAVFTLRRELSGLREDPEQPVLMGGTFRGIAASLEAVKFSGLDVYVKTINIAH